MESLPVIHFDTLCRFVSRTYDDVLSEREKQWLDALSSLSDPAKILYVRLLSRRHNVFRVSKIDYAEISDVSQAVKDLAAVSLACTAAPQNPEQINRLYTKAEIISIFNRQDLKALRKLDLLDSLYSDQNEEALLRLQQGDQWVTLLGHDVYSWFLLCFFGNRYQDMSEFVVRELGHVSYFPYQIDKGTRAFQSRDQIDAHLQYYECEALYEQTDKRDIDALIELDNTLPEYNPDDPNLSRRIDRLRIRLARQLERLAQFDEALTLFERCSRAPARERRVRIYLKQAEHAKAWALLEEIKHAPYGEDELQFVETIRPKIARLLDVKPKNIKPFKPVSSKLVLAESGVRVEAAACEYYQRSGQCFYVENSLVNGVLGLLIWPEIFSPLPGAFYNPFQSAPSDFYDSGFVSRRAINIEACLDMIDGSRFQSTVLSRFEQYVGYANPLVRWDYLNEPLLKLALATIPKEHWRALFDRQLSDLRNNTSGLPDLIHFPKTGGYELIEIKGPGDAVQKNQTRWFRYFESKGIPYRVVNIKWSKTLSAGVTE